MTYLLQAQFDSFKLTYILGFHCMVPVEVVRFSVRFPFLTLFLLYLKASSRDLKTMLAHRVAAEKLILASVTHQNSQNPPQPSPRPRPPQPCGTQKTNFPKFCVLKWPCFTVNDIDISSTNMIGQLSKEMVHKTAKIHMNLMIMKFRRMMI